MSTNYQKENMYKIIILCDILVTIHRLCFICILVFQGTRPARIKYQFTDIQDLGSTFIFQHQ